MNPGCVVIALDTTVFVEDWLLGSPAGSLIRDQGASGTIALLVPELVIREAVGVYGRTFKRTQRDLRDVLRRRRRLDAGAPDAALGKVELSVDPVAASQNYEVALRATLASAGTQVLPLPTVGHEELVQRSLDHRKPFDHDGHAGYRDALIWHTVLDAATAAGRVVLVSANSSDFAFSRKEPDRLAQHLQDDVVQMAERQGSPMEIVLCRDLAAVIERELAPEHGLLMRLRERVRTDRAFRRALREQLNGAWVHSYPDVDVDPDSPADWDGDLELDMVGDLHDFEIVGVTSPDEGPAFVRITGHADVQVALQVHMPTSARDWDNPELDDVQWNEHTGTGTWIAVLPAELTLHALYESNADHLAKIDLESVIENLGLGHGRSHAWRAGCARRLRHGARDHAARSMPHNMPPVNPARGRGWKLAPGGKPVPGDRPAGPVSRSSARGPASRARSSFRL